MTEQLVAVHQRQMLEDAAAWRVRRKPSWLRRSFSALRRSPVRRRHSPPATIGHMPPPQHVEDAVALG